MRLDNFILDIVGCLFFVLLLKSSAVSIQLLRVGLYLDDPLLRLPSHLLEDAYKVYSLVNKLNLNEKNLTCLLPLRFFHRHKRAL